MSIASSRRTIAVGAVSIMIALAAIVVPAQTASAAPATYGVGSTTLAQPQSGGRFIYVATNGTDKYQQYSRITCLLNPADQPKYQDKCPEPTAAAPLQTIQAGIRAARPGDVIVVRGGVYKEAIGWGHLKGTSTRPIVLQAAVGERVEVNGTLIMSDPDYWTIAGMRFTHNSTIQGSGQAVVLFSGGIGWRFRNNEVTGTTGVANVLVNATRTSGSASQLTAAAPRQFEIAGNCIHDNRATDAAGTDHNIYLMSSIYSTGGLIERNLIAGAPRGANIKAAGSTPATASGSPRNVTIRYNTMLNAASGLTIGLAAERVESMNNIIALPVGSGKYDGAVKTYQLASPDKNSAKYSLLSGYAKPISEDFGVNRHLYTKGNDTSSGFSYTGSIANCTARAASSVVLSKYGQYAG